jgi:hypothetical protein
VDHHVSAQLHLGTEIHVTPEQQAGRERGGCEFVPCPLIRSHTR